MGVGTPRDLRESLDWFRRAAELGDKRAVTRLKQHKQPVPPLVGTPPKGGKAARAEILDSDDPNDSRRRGSKDSSDCVVS
jgi:TPR repeat protein